MTNRVDIDRSIRDLHAARVSGDLAAMCRLFAASGIFQIVGSSDGKPVSIKADGIKQFQPWLAMMVKAFRMSNYELLSLTIEDNRGAAHWRAKINSKITGVTVLTELVDLVEIRDSLIIGYTEFFVPR